MTNKENPDIYGCSACGEEVFPPTSKYMKICWHHQKHHSADDDTKDVLLCTLCKETFLDPTAIKHHVTRRHKTEHRPSRCNLCQLGFRSAYSARIHKETVHQRDENEECLACEVCAKNFSSKQSLLTHVKGFHGEVSREQKRARKAMASERSRVSKEKRIHQTAVDDPGTCKTENSSSLHLQLFKKKFLEIGLSKRYFIFPS